MAFPSFGGFNSSTQSQQPAFGYASTQSSFNFGGGAFGQGAQQPQQPTFGGFGQSGQQGGYGFGQSTAPTFGAGAFGAGSKTQGTGFGFGGLQGQQQAQTQSAFGFGGGFQANTTAAPAFNAFAQTRTAAPTFGGGGFGGFGNTSTKPTTSFTFNQPSQQPQGVFGAQQTQSAFTGFGGAAATTTSAPTFGGGFGGFGGSSTSAGTGLSTGFGGFGGFGATTSTTSAFPSAFGQTTAAAFSFNPSQSGGLAPASSGFSFNAPGTGFAGNSAFGNKSVGSGFGQTRTSGTFAFGPTGGLGTGRGVGGAQQPQTVYEQLRSIMNSWDPKSPESKFQTYLYNMVHPNEAAQHIPPADRPRKLWDEAQANNPDRTCLVPALMTNFEDLQKRLTHQESAATTCKATIDKLSKEIDGMEEIHNLQTLITLENYKRKYMQLTQRIISLMIKLQLKHLRNTAVSVEEQQLQAEIEKLNHDLKGPNQKVSQLKMQSSILKTQMMPSSGIKQKYEVVDGKEMEALVRVLAEEQTGIAHVIETVQKDSDDVQKMSNELIGEQMGMNMITDTVSR